MNERADERLRMPVNGAGSALRDPSFEASRVHVQAGKFRLIFRIVLRFRDGGTSTEQLFVTFFEFKGRPYMLFFSMKGLEILVP